MSKNNEWINDVGIIATSKAGKPYIKIDKEITLRPGDCFMLKSKIEELEEAHKAGKINEDRFEELKDKLSFIKYTLHKMPYKPNPGD